MSGTLKVWKEWFAKEKRRFFPTVYGLSATLDVLRRRIHDESNIQIITP